MNCRKAISLCIFIFGVYEIGHITLKKCSTLPFDFFSSFKCGTNSFSYYIPAICIALLGVYIFFKVPWYEKIGFRYSSDEDAETFVKSYRRLKLFIMFNRKNRADVMISFSDKENNSFSLEKLFLNDLEFCDRCESFLEFKKYDVDNRQEFISRINERLTKYDESNFI